MENNCSGCGKFYGVYLLCSQSLDKRYNGKCYVGFTVNPNRRINQHNRGKEFGGAKKTSDKGPWQMVMIIHGFPNNIAALQFEWAWQQPNLSSRLRIYPELRRKAPKETYFQYNFRILSQMLVVGPWNRLPLIIRWLEPRFEREFELSKQPPRHMKIVSGKIEISKAKSAARDDNSETFLPSESTYVCHICLKTILFPERSRVGCLNAYCTLSCHITCLARHFIAADDSNRGHYIPIKGRCPLCDMEITWAALLNYKANQQLHSEEKECNEIGEEFSDEII